MTHNTNRKTTAARLTRRVLTALLSLALMLGLFPAAAQAAVLEWPTWTLTLDETDADDTADSHSQAAIVMDADSGAILYADNAETAYYPASITKIMTAMLALENCSLDEVVTFSEDAVYNTEGSSIARDVGEQMTMEECLYGMMLASANECAYAIGEHVAGGSIDDFVDMMNARAEELGCINTHFANSSGLPDDDHYVCAYDMALIAKAAYEIEEFRTICGTSYYEIAPTNKHDEITYLTNHHNMLCAYTTTEYLRDYCLGGKTGYTQAAGSTLVTYAGQDGMTLICVVLAAESPNHWLDTISLLEYYFEKCESQTVAVETGLEDLFFETQIAALQEDAAFLEVTTTALDVILPSGADVSDAEYSVTSDETGSTAGTIHVSYNGTEVGTTSIDYTDFTPSDWTSVVAMSGSDIEEEEKVGAQALLADAASTVEQLVVVAGLALLALLVTVVIKLMQRRERRRQQAAAEEALQQGADAPAPPMDKRAAREEKRRRALEKKREKELAEKREKTRAKNREKSQRRREKRLKKEEKRLSSDQKKRRR